MTRITKILLLMTIVSTAVPALGQSDNPLLEPWNTPYQTPPFSQIRNIRKNQCGKAMELVS